MSLTIFTDSASNLPLHILEEYNIKQVLFEYLYCDKLCSTPDCDDFDDIEYYTAIKAGMTVTTSQINPQKYSDAFRPELENGNDVLYIGMSSGISGSYRSACIAINELAEEYPDRKIHAFDTRAASLAEGITALYASELRENGHDFDEIISMLETYRESVCQYFTVDDLMFLRRTGRVTMTSAVIGTMLRIKPVLRGNALGKIITCAKATGRMGAIRSVVKAYTDRVENWENQTIGIAHANCLEDAETMKKMINESGKMPKDIIIAKYEPVTGSHVGPGALALFFCGQRED